MLKINTTREVWYPVTLELLNEGDEAGTTRHTIEVKYQLPKRKELLARAASAQATALDVQMGRSDLVQVIDDDELADWVFSKIKNWRGLTDENNEPIDCTPENMRAVCDAYPAIFNALEMGLYNAARDEPVKN